MRATYQWKPAKFVNRLYEAIENQGYEASESIHETWVRRLEKGKVKKIPNWLITAICDALGCSQIERVDLFVTLGRTPLTGCVSHPVLMVLHCSIMLDEEELALLEELIGHRRADQLNEKEIEEILCDFRSLRDKKRRRH